MKSTQEITQEVRELGQWIPGLRQQVGHVVIGQKYLVDRLLLGLLANGHLLLEGVPGLAKTLTVKTMAACIQTGFQRLQFTPDLLPADLIGTLIYNPRTGEFTTKLGPIFSNLILADEINRAPAKVQSALLEAMQEKQVTIGDSCYVLRALAAGRARILFLLANGAASKIAERPAAGSGTSAPTAPPASV